MRTYADAYASLPPASRELMDRYHAALDAWVASGVGPLPDTARDAYDAVKADPAAAAALHLQVAEAEAELLCKS